MSCKVLESQDIDVASIDPIHSFLSLYIDRYIIGEGYQRRKWVGRHDDAFAGIFVAHTGLQIPILDGMCRETLNPNIGTVTSKSTCRLFLHREFFMTFILLPFCFGEPLSDVTF